jgi:hypothetical protein
LEQLTPPGAATDDGAVDGRSDRQRGLGGGRGGFLRPQGHAAHERHERGEGTALEEIAAVEVERERGGGLIVHDAGLLQCLRTLENLLPPP